MKAAARSHLRRRRAGLPATASPTVRPTPGAFLSSLALCAFLIAQPQASMAAPLFQADPTRSQVSDRGWDFPLHPAWVYRPAQPPRPAWPEPGKEQHRLDFDYAFQPVADATCAFFGSSADDSVRAVDLATGELRWRFTAGAPVRFAPALDGDALLAAADDGYLYCLDAKTGAERWRFHGAPTAEMLLGNGRMISRWPVRTGPVTKGGTVYFAAGMWPSEGIYVYAVEVATGKELWRNDSSGYFCRRQPHGGSAAFTGVCPQGYALATDDLLLIPSGRTTPAAFDLRTGELRYYQPYLNQLPYAPEGWENRGNGGCYLTVAGPVFFNSMHPGGAGDIDVALGEAGPQAGDGLVAYDLASGLRRRELREQHRAAVAGGVLYAVGAGALSAIKFAPWLADGRIAENTLWSVPCGRAYAIAVAGDAALVGGAGEIAAFDRQTGQRRWSHAAPGQVRGLAVTAGGLLAATADGSVTLFAAGDGVPQPADGAATETPTWDVAVREANLQAVADLLSRPSPRAGYALVVGAEDAALAALIAAETQLHVVAALPHTADLAAARQALLTTGHYGSRIHVVGMEPEKAAPAAGTLPFAPYFADLIAVVGDPTRLAMAEVYRLLRPCGGILHFVGATPRQMDRALAASGCPPAEIHQETAARFIRRGPLPGAGEWRQQWADAGNTGLGDDTLARPPFRLLWFGGPGPERILSRHLGPSAPLSVAGRVFVGGQHHVLCFDAYTGRELWCQELQGAGRKYAGIKSTNLVADDAHLYLAVRDRCYRLDQQTGQPVGVYTIPAGGGAATVDLGRDLVAVEWPSAWQVLGPFSKEAADLGAAELRAIPDQLVWRGTTFRPQRLQAVNGVADLTCLYGGFGQRPLAADESPPPYPRPGGYTGDGAEKARTAYLLAELDVPTDGKLLVGAAADWTMEWFIDGAPVAGELSGGKDTVSAENVFTVPVAKGKRLLAVKVEAGSAGWCLTSFGGARYLPQFRRLAGGSPTPGWGYLSLADDLVLCGVVRPSANWLPDYRGPGVIAFAKADGTVRWRYDAPTSILSYPLAHGDGRLFLLETTSANAPGRTPAPTDKSSATLVALDLATGAVRWRQSELPPVSFNSWAQLEIASIKHAAGTVVVNDRAAYDAATGKSLWQGEAGGRGGCVIRDGKLVSQTMTRDLRTGAEEKVRDPVFGQTGPRQIARSYGCGPVAGTANMLFFRSAAVGFYDFDLAGTGNFGGVRPGCAQNMVAANGLFIVPESASGCSCSYNFQTSLALAPAPARADQWCVFAGGTPDGTLRDIKVNFGAPGDCRDPAGGRWFAVPRPEVAGAAPVPVTVLAANPRWYFAPHAAVAAGIDPQIYRSGIGCPATIRIDLAPAAPLFVPPASAPPTVDGTMDDPCWTAQPPIPLEGGKDTLEPRCELHLSRDDGHLYAGFQVDVGQAASHPPAPAATAAGPTPPADGPEVWRDDWVGLCLTDAAGTGSLTLVINRNGTVADFKGRPRDGFGQDHAWTAKFARASRLAAGRWTTEIAIPFAELRAAGLDPATLRLNAAVQNAADQGGGTPAQRRHLIPADFEYCREFRPLATEPPPAAPRNYRLKLHFLGTGGGDSVAPLAIALNGRVALADFRPPGPTAGGNAAITKEFRGITADRELLLTIGGATDSGAAGAAAGRVTLCGLELAIEREDAAR